VTAPTRAPTRARASAPAADRRAHAAADEAAAHGGRTRDDDPEAGTFRTARRPVPPIPPGTTVAGPPGERTIIQRLAAIETRLGAIQRTLYALARAQGIDPE
jgi:hypothetical protein